MNLTSTQFMKIKRETIVKTNKNPLNLRIDGLIPVL